MKKNIHPQYHQAQVICGGCGNTFTAGATVKEIRVGVCSQCHPFYTGRQTMIDVEGRIDKFKRKFGGFPGLKKGNDSSNPSE